MWSTIMLDMWLCSLSQVNWRTDLSRTQTKEITYLPMLSLPMCYFYRTWVFVLCIGLLDIFTPFEMTCLLWRSVQRNKDLKVAHVPQYLLEQRSISGQNLPWTESIYAQLCLRSQIFQTWDTELSEHRFLSRMEKNKRNKLINEKTWYIIVRLK